jgi:hypothetical protein
MRYLIVFLILLTQTQLFSQNQTPAFPTAEGYGMWATGGRGGKVVAVTNLGDKDRRGLTIDGTLRWALAQYPGEPITIVFKVSGIIDLLGNDLRSNRSNVTIAGQTAPGDGICVKGGKVNLGGSQNVIIRHMRFRVGLLESGAFIEGGALGYENGGNFIIDHCTFGWSGEENMTIYDNKLTTIQWCIVHEGLYNVGHPKGVRGYGSQWGGETSTYHHNLLAHNVSRTPRVNGSRSNDHNVLMDYVNNVNYNWGKSNSAYGGDFDAAGQSHTCNWINNYYKPGPARPGSSSSFFVQSSFGNQTKQQIAKWYLSGNYMEGSANTALNTDNTLGLDASAYTSQGILKSDMISTTPFQVPYALNVESAENAFQSVLAKAGAFPRDTIDARILNETKTGTAVGTGSYGAAGMIDHPSIVGGFPTYNTYHTIKDKDADGIADYWEVANGLDSTNTADGNNLTADGYTFLEAYLNGLTGEFLTGINYPAPVYTDVIPEDTTTVKPLATLAADAIAVYFDFKENTIKINQSEKVNRLMIYDLQGKILTSFSGDIQSTTNVSYFPKGMYIVKIETKSGNIQQTKFVKR